MYDFLIVGQGIAGSVLSWHLMKAGYKVLVIDKQDLSSASAIAAGVTNPVTGRRMVKTWRADELVPCAAETYRALEQETGASFFSPLRIVRLFDSMKSQNDWSSRCALPEYSPYLESEQIVWLNRDKIKNELGGFEIRGGSQLHIRLFLTSFRSYLRRKSALIEDQFYYDRLWHEGGLVHYHDTKVRNIVFCEGTAARQNPFLPFLPLHPAKGQCLILKIPGLHIDFMIKSEVLLLPYYEKDTYYLGATHESRYDTLAPTAAGLSQLLSGVDSFLRRSYTLMHHWSAVRPAVKDRRPVIGRHPEKKNFWIFNGMGTKGVSLAPWLSERFVAHVRNGDPLPEDADIARFF